MSIWSGHSWNSYFFRASCVCSPNNRVLCWYTVKQVDGFEQWCNYWCYLSANTSCLRGQHRELRETGFSEKRLIRDGWLIAPNTTRAKQLGKSWRVDQPWQTDFLTITYHDCQKSRDHGDELNKKQSGSGKLVIILSMIKLSTRRNRKKTKIAANCETWNLLLLVKTHSKFYK